MQNKLLVGITGGSGTGKTTVSHIFRKSGIEVIDCDVLARAVTEKGHPCLKELAEEFGSDILMPDGGLDRKKLGSIVFSAQEKLSMLNKITHKYILDMVFQKAKECGSPIVGIDGAVLFESGVTGKLDRVIGILSDREKRIERITARDGISREMAEKRLNSQKPDDFFTNNCDFIIYNNGDIIELEKRVGEVVSKLVHDINDEKRKNIISLD